MKKYLCYTILIAVAAAGCDNYLSETPDNRALLDSKEQLAELLVSAYPRANYMMFCEAMSDNVEDNPSGTASASNTEPYFWNDGTTSTQDTPDYYWAACYAAIAAANQALEFIDNAADAQQYDAQKGEALVARAYSHFMLVALFAETYSASPADASNPGIPYVTQPEKDAFVHYDRGTVKDVYDKIEADLVAGLPLIDDRAYTDGDKGSGVHKYHFTQAAAHAFATRFYLFRRDYEKVIAHANVVFPGNDFAARLRPVNTTYDTYSLAQLLQTYGSATEPANLLLCETASWWARSYDNVRYATGSDKEAEILGTNPTGKGYRFSIYINNASNVIFVPKFDEHFVRRSVNATTGVGYTILPLFSAEEVLFNRAEAYAASGNTAAAINDINTWIARRVSNYQPADNLTLAELTDFYAPLTTLRIVVLASILDMRRAEFLHEGLRWFDILRYGAPVTHAVSGEASVVLGADDPRRVLQIPKEAVSTGGLVANPR